MGGTGAALTSDEPAPGEQNRRFASCRSSVCSGRTCTADENPGEGLQLLDQQYELARIEEAKEILTVKMIDPANLPEKGRGHPGC